MAPIPEARIQELRARIDMVALVQRHGVPLKKSGLSYKGLCPFHGEKSPSFYVWPVEKRFKCFGCEVGGDAIHFVQRLLGKTFTETVKDLAEEMGVDLGAVLDPDSQEKAQIKNVAAFAEHHFMTKLWDPVVGAHALAYLRGRGLTDAAIQAFGIGWAPPAWTELADAMRARGMLAYGEKAGLVSARQRGEGFFDVFRGRVMIPIRNPEGRAIAFGGRLLTDEDGPKYLNSKDSRVYSKSDVLYGTDLARSEIRRSRTVVLCEGYFDVMALHQAGCLNSLAICSTALTPGHLSLLARFEAKEMVLLLDGDEAGRKAVERHAGMLLGAGLNARVAVLPNDVDPDTFAQHAGPAGVWHLIESAKPLTVHLFDLLLPHGITSSYEAKMTAIDRLRPILQQVPVGMLRSVLLTSMAQQLGAPVHELEPAFKAAPAPLVQVVPADELQRVEARLHVLTREMARQNTRELNDEYAALWTLHQRLIRGA